MKVLKYADLVVNKQFLLLAILKKVALPNSYVETVTIPSKSL